MKKNAAGLRVEDVNPKKLALWDTRTFRPILTHDELDLILSPLGFAPLPLPPPPEQPPREGGGGGEERGGAARPPGQAVWREYVFTVWAPADGRRCNRWPSPAPRPRLPYPRIDGLHLMAYKAFLVALEFYLGPTAVPNLFHVRTMPLTRKHDLEFDKFYRPMIDSEIDDEGILVYRVGTLDHITKMACSQCCSNDEDGNVTCSNTITEHCIKKADDKKENPGNLIYLVPLKDLFPSRNAISSS